MTNMEEPFFVIESLDTITLTDVNRDDRAYKAVIFAVNQKGRSPRIVLKDFIIGDNQQTQTVIDENTFQLSPIIIGILLTLLILACFVAIRIYTKKRTKTNETLDHSKQSSSLLCSQDAAKKNPKSSPRWQYNDTKRSKEGTGDGTKIGTTEIIEDERDPDVIPAQYVSNEVGLTYTTQWTNEAYYDKYPNHESRPKNLLLKSVTTSSQQQLQQQQHQLNQHHLQQQQQQQPHQPQDLILGTYFPDSKELTGIDLDINVHAIKNMLMATRVPESCV